MDAAISEDVVKSVGKSIKSAIKKQKGSNSFKEIKEIRQKLSSSEIETWLVTLPGIIDFSKISYFIPDNSEKILFDFLSLDLKCKEIDFKSLTVKQAVDCAHPILGDLVDEFYSNDFDLVREKLFSFDAGLLEGYDYFNDYFDDKNVFNKKNVVRRISELAEIAEKATKTGKAALSKVSHAPKFSYPDAYYPRIYIRGKFRSDGFVKTGNTDACYDMHINATILSLYKFLALKIKGSTVLEHFECRENTILEDYFKVDKEVVQQWRDSFLCCTQNEDYRTSALIKQVYFPANGNYHQLSILFPSSLVFTLKKRIDEMNSRSGSAYLGKSKEFKKNNKYLEKGFDSILDLTLQRHGGTKPRNISALNNKYQNVYLLPCMPPALQKRKIRLPRYNFFENSLWTGNFKESFDALHKLLAVGYNNINIREGRDNIITFIVDQVIDVMWSIRQHKPGWSRSDHYSNLSAHQKIWLDNINNEERESEDEWLHKIVEEFSRWLVFAYKKPHGKQAVSLGDKELLHIKGLIEENMEVLR